MEEDTQRYYYSDDDNDDSFVDYTTHYTQHQPYRTRDEFQPEEESAKGVLFWLDYVTGPQFALLVAISVIVVFQFQDVLWRYQYDIWDACRRLWWQAHDYTRAYAQMGMEQFRRVWAACTPSKEGGRRRRRLRRDTASSLPELEEVPILSSNRQMEPTAGSGKEEVASSPISSRASTGNTELPPSRRRLRIHGPTEIEPAFLNESDYPPGWMVYHPVLGVVPKSRADKYDEKERSRESSTTQSSSSADSSSSNGAANGNSPSTENRRYSTQLKEQQEEEGSSSSLSQPSAVLQSIAANG